MQNIRTVEDNDGRQERQYVLGILNSLITHKWDFLQELLHVNWNKTIYNGSVDCQ